MVRTDRLFLAAVYTFLFLLSAAMIFPLLYVLAVSFTDPKVYVPDQLTLWPKKWSLSAYEYILSGGAIVNALKSTLFITVVGTPISLIVTSSFAYMLSKNYLPGRNVMLLLVLFTMLFSPGMIPNYLLIRNLGLLDSLWALILPMATNAWSILVMKSFYQSIPSELEDSARIDGCNDLQIYSRIILPLSKAPMAAFTLFFAVAFWNVYFSALLYLRDSTQWTLQVILQQVVLASNASQFVDSAVASQMDNIMTMPPETVKMATIIIVIAPILLVYPFLQKHFAKGVLIGSVKG
ncbi:carbohydrate ABC transporter permease [Paenibacillus antri]|uniref:Carbohydrate ABC transporter permease n=1 Tax=Paenibacillus antri TaxID=2582848 RepID=A0A5R9GH87_9BACL|nr:carbohydrate ABC transporter permease [Paenibacillus antri]TLS53816.1 carbohydrate ABC transporter permease [Paenibacillus antri]